jgi:hypothetical protein
VSHNPLSADPFVGFLNRGSVLRETMQKYGGSLLVKEVQNSITGLSHPEPRFPELPFNL